MEYSKIEFLLSGFEFGCHYAYVSVFEFNSRVGNSYCRIEMVADNIGRLCLYQTFVDSPDGEQMPKFKVFYSTASEYNCRTLIKSPDLLRRAVNIIYKRKKFCESHPEMQIKKDTSVLNAVNNNVKLANKIYATHKPIYGSIIMDSIQK